MGKRKKRREVEKIIKKIHTTKELDKMIEMMEKVEKKPVQEADTVYNPNLDSFIKILFELGWLLKNNNNDVEKMPHYKGGKYCRN